MLIKYSARGDRSGASFREGLYHEPISLDLKIIIDLAAN
jgi:hypothetical protein